MRRKTNSCDYQGLTYLRFQVAEPKSSAGSQAEKVPAIFLFLQVVVCIDLYKSSWKNTFAENILASALQERAQ
jgi:hypothetical protein